MGAKRRLEQQCSVVLGGKRCDRPVARRGLCQAHRNQQARDKPFRPALGAHGSKGPRTQVLVRIAASAHNALERQAVPTGGSAYSVSNEILEAVAEMPLSVLARLRRAAKGGSPYKLMVDVISAWVATPGAVESYVEDDDAGPAPSKKSAA